MAEIDIDHELKHVSGILSDVETLDLPWSEQELAGFDWFMAVGGVRRLQTTVAEMDERQKVRFDAILKRIDAVKDKLAVLDLVDPLRN